MIWIWNHSLMIAKSQVYFNDIDPSSSLSFLGHCEHADKCLNLHSI